MSLASTMDFQRIAATALLSADTLLPRWLPAGKRERNEYRTGNLRGDAGRSLAVDLTTGKWRDRAEEGIGGGDLIALYAAIHGVKQSDAAQAVAKELGIDAGGPAKINGKTHRREWIYTDSAGQPIRKAVRIDPGKKRWQEAWKDGRWTAEKGSTTGLPFPLYGCGEIADAPAGTLVVVCEGEPARDACAEKLGELGIATCWPAGSSNADKVLLEPLLGKRICLWPDRDADGRKAMAVIHRRLVAMDVKAALMDPDRWPEMPPKGDAANVDWDTDRLLAEIQAAEAAPVSIPSSAPTTATAFDLMQRTFAALVWIVDQLIPEGTILIAGKPKSGKSWFVLNLLLSCCFAISFLRRETVQCGVLYLALEDNDRRMKQRLGILMRLYEDKIERLRDFHYRCDWPAGLEGADALDEYLSANAAIKVVAVDVLKKIRPVADVRRNAYDLDYEAIAPWKAVADKHRVTLLLVHHSRKAEADDVFDEISGTLGINGAVDQMVVLRRLPGDDRGATLHMRGRDLPEDQELGIQLRDGWWEFQGPAAQLAANDARRVVLDCLHEDGPMKTGDLLKATGKRSRSALSNLLARMVKDGLITRSTEGYSLSSTTT